jgi:opine dehydrogenase
MREEKVVILGGGNGALAFAAYLGLRGEKVCLWEFPQFRKSLEWVYQYHRILATGEIQGEAEVRCYDDLKQALQDATLLMAVVPAFAHQRLAEELAPFLEADAILVLNPGRTGGALEVASILGQKGRSNPVAEAQTLLFACRRKGERGVHFNGIKHLVKIGVFPSKKTEEVMARLNRIFLQFRPVPDVLSTSLGNIGAMFHPASAILNIGIIQSGRAYDYYRETMTPAVVKVIEEADEERMAIAKGAGAEVFSAQAWLRESYQLEETSLYEMLQSNRAYQGISGPTVIHGRHITEDVPTGLVPMEAFAELYGISTPTISALISIANSLIGVDFRSTGRNLKRLGLTGMSPSDIPAFMREGVRREFGGVGDRGLPL